jgi:hypothetical protein
VLFFDSNKNFHAHPNNEIENGGRFLSILDLEFWVQFISELKFLHPNRPLGEWILRDGQVLNLWKTNNNEIASERFLILEFGQQNCKRFWDYVIIFMFKNDLLLKSYKLIILPEKINNNITTTYDLG